MDEIVRRVLSAAGGATKLAKSLGISSPSPYSWRHQIPAKRVLDIERITGIPREELRPDLFRSPDDAA